MQTPLPSLPAKESKDGVQRLRANLRESSRIIGEQFLAAVQAQKMEPEVFNRRPGAIGRANGVSGVPIIRGGAEKQLGAVKGDGSLLAIRSIGRTEPA